MSEPTSKFTEETIDFITRNAGIADKIAAELGISRNALIGAIANEYDTRFNLDLSLDLRGGVVQSLTDWLASGESHQTIYENYTAIKNGTPDSFGKLRNIVQIDVGPGNIRIETAIDVLNDYLGVHSKTGTDPLNLKQYDGHYDKLIEDLSSFDNIDATFAIGGLVTQQADDFFKSKDAAAWSRMTPDEQDSLRIMHYKLGPQTLSRNIDRRISDAKQSGNQFDFNPHGDGGQQHLNNIREFNGALYQGLSGLKSPQDLIVSINYDSRIQTNIDGTKEVKNYNRATGLLEYEENFSKSGVITKSIGYLNKKKAVETLYDDVGKPKLMKYYHPSNGVLYNEIHFQSDGKKLVIGYDPNTGRKTSEDITDADMNPIDIKRYDSTTGNMTSTEHHNKDKSYTRAAYDAITGHVTNNSEYYSNGNIKFSKSFNKDTGIISYESFYSLDGSKVCNGYDQYGRKEYEQHYDSNGNQTYRYDKSKQRSRRHADTLASSPEKANLKDLTSSLWKTEIERQAELREQGIDDTGQPVTDLEGLRFAFGSNRDKMLDTRDERWNEFRVWQDKNQNGVTDPGELLTMEQAGIRLIDLMPSKEGVKAFADGSAITGTSQAQIIDGTRMLVGDVTLAYRPSLSA